MEKLLEYPDFIVKAIFITVKYVGLCLFVWFFEPLYDLMILQIPNYALLSPYAKEVLADLKIILGVIVAFLVAVNMVRKLFKKEEKK